MEQVTQLLQQWAAGDTAALEQLTPLVYPELRRLAQGYLRRERGDVTLQPTELVHEAYLRLMSSRPPNCESRTHFYGIAALLMRQVLVDHAREFRAVKRGGGVKPLALDEPDVLALEQADNLLALHEALNGLARLDDRKSRAIELRFFGGLTVEEIGSVLNVSPSTVVRELRLAEAWLRREMCAEE